MEGLFIIGNDHLSGVSISKPLHLLARPKSSRHSQDRVGSGLLLSSNPAAFADSVSFPQILNTDQGNSINKSTGHNAFNIKTVSIEDERTSTFPNFRLFQRLAASAKSRLSRESETDDQNLDGGTVLKTGCNKIVSDTYMQLVKQHEKTGDSPQSTPRRPKSRKTKRVTRKSSKNGDLFSRPKSKTPSKPDFSRSYQLSKPPGSDTIPTFSKKFKKRGMILFNNSKSSKKKETKRSSESLHQNHTPYPESVISSKEESLLNSSRNFGSGESLQQKHEIQVATLHSIYAVSNRRAKPTKVFQSEKQSGSMKQCGKLVPCAPPTSPTPELLERYHYVPSMSDLRSQQSVKNRLAAMEKEAQKKLEQQREDLKKKEKQLLHAQMLSKRVRQRQEIYALNKIMTKLEFDTFKAFCEKVDKR